MNYSQGRHVFRRVLLKLHKACLLIPTTCVGNLFGDTMNLNHREIDLKSCLYIDAGTNTNIFRFRTKL